MDDIETRIRDAMAAVLGVVPDEVDDDTSPETVPEWDSVQHIHLVLALQEEFGVVFEPDEVMDMLSYRVIVHTVREKRS